METRAHVDRYLNTADSGIEDVLNGGGATFHFRPRNSILATN